MIGWFISGVAFGAALVNLVWCVVHYVDLCKRLKK